MSTPLSGTRLRRRNSVRVRGAYNGPSSPTKAVHFECGSRTPQNYQLVTVMYEPDQDSLVHHATIPVINSRRNEDNTKKKCHDRFSGD
jgi:hypothetical protein